MAHFDLLGPFRPEPRSGFGALRREMDDLFDRFGGFSPTAARAAFPPLNLYETPEAFVLTAELPGVAPEDLEVSLEGSTVTLRGERKAPPADEASVHRSERLTGSFQRAIDLSVTVDGDKVEAVHRHGVLTLRLPKAAEHRPRQIRVKAA